MKTKRKGALNKLAFVLILALAAALMPARAAAAAPADGPQMYSTLKLYIGGDVTGAYAESRYVKVWNKGSYTVAFSIDDESVATVNSRGYVTAVKVGSATVTAAFTAADGSVVTRTCAVTVKKNAVRAGLSSASARRVTQEGIKAGESVQLTAVRRGADGESVRRGRDVLTDGVRFASSDEGVFTVTKTTGRLTGVAEGTAVLYVWAVQSEGKDPVTGELPATTKKREYTVVVRSDESREEQTGRVLVAYFSASGSTKAVADTIAKRTGADTFAIIPVDGYTDDDLDWTSSGSRVNREHEDADLQDIALVSAAAENFEAYDTVFIGYPIWWGEASWVVNNFVKENDFTGKTVIPFCTSVSSGMGSSGINLERLAGTGNWQEGQRFRANAGEDEVARWLEGLGF